MKNFTTLEFVLMNIVGTKIRLEARPTKYLFGSLNYGEVVENWYNRADGDRWDVFAPGYKKHLSVGDYTVDSIVGILKLDNENHKIAVRLSDANGDKDNTFCEIRCCTEVERYTNIYTKRVKVNGEFVYLNPPTCIIADT